jgi:hypothetical protein
MRSSLGDGITPSSSAGAIGLTELERRARVFATFAVGRVIHGDTH